jgi:hypothetical protein
MTGPGADKVQRTPAPSARGGHRLDRVLEVVRVNLFTALLILGGLIGFALMTLRFIFVSYGMWHPRAEEEWGWPLAGLAWLGIVWLLVVAGLRKWRDEAFFKSRLGSLMLVVLIAAAMLSGGWIFLRLVGSLASILCDYWWPVPV